MASHFDTSNLTTPAKIDKNVAAFCRSLSKEAPIFVKVLPQLWSRQSCCEMNVEKRIEECGGEKRIGYKVWYLSSKYIEAERHVIHENNNILSDPTFNVDGEMEILFVPDSIPLPDFESRESKLCRGFSLRGKRFAEQLRLQVNNTHRLTKEASWHKMITYKQWLAGERQANTWVQQESGKR